MIHYSNKIAVALSGGVDSAVAAKILQKEGHEVIGLFLKLWKYDGVDESEIKARKVADFLRIPFYAIDAKEEFKNTVVSNFIEEYANCCTPNPCVLCNPEVKFKLLLKKAADLGCDFLATGHYARIENSENQKSQKAKKLQATSYKLFSGFDPSKDQSYMLYRLSQEQLSKIIFPLGELTKKQVRALAREWQIPVAEEAESQEICFLKNADYRDFLRKELGDKYFHPGEIVDSRRNIIGEHEGLVNYTVGQRRQIDQNAKIKDQNDNLKVKGKKPLYVIGYNVENNRLIVGEDSEVYSREMVVGNLNWIDGSRDQEIEKLKDLTVKIRSQAQKVECDIKNNESRITNNEIEVIFKEPQRAITSGQSAVFYVGDEVVGGGIIINSKIKNQI